MKLPKAYLVGWEGGERPVISLFLRQWPLWLSVLLALGTAWLDWHMGFGLRIGPLYVVPAGLMAWKYGPWVGTFSALVLTAAWHSVEFWNAGALLTAMDTNWNLLVRLATLVSVALASAWAQASLERQRRLALELREAMDKVKTLEGLLPICAWCRKVRDDKGTWEQIEAYIEKNSNATWTHGICPDCRKRMLDDLGPRLDS